MYRNNADQEVVEQLQAENTRLRKALYEMEVEYANLVERRCKEGAAVFMLRRTPKPEMITNHDSWRDPLTDNITLLWSRAARVAGIALGDAGYVRGETLLALRQYQSIHAQNYWHLCAKIGITEAVARTFFDHPEADQPSAVSRVAGIRERLNTTGWDPE